MTKQIADIILAQLGGNRFIAMTGASSFSHGTFKNGPGLSMRLPKTPKGKWMGLRIELTPSDTYSLTFLKQAGSWAKGNFSIKEHTIDNVYADNLRQVFTAETDLFTSLTG